MGRSPTSTFHPARAGSDHIDMQVYEAVVTLPMAHVLTATAQLRGDLRHRTSAEGFRVLPDWHSLRVLPPVMLFDDAGRVVYQYRATVEVHDAHELLAPPVAT